MKVVTHLQWCEYGMLLAKAATPVVLTSFYNTTQSMYHPMALTSVYSTWWWSSQVVLMVGIMMSVVTSATVLPMWKDVVTVTVAYSPSIAVRLHAMK